MGNEIGIGSELEGVGGEGEMTARNGSAREGNGRKNLRIKERGTCCRSGDAVCNYNALILCAKLSSF